MSLQAFYNPEQSGHGLIVHWPAGAKRPDQGTWYAYSARDGQPIWLSFGEADSDGDEATYNVYRYACHANISPAAPMAFPMGGDGPSRGNAVGTLSLRVHDGQLTLNWRIDKAAVGVDGSEVLPSPLPPGWEEGFVTGQMEMLRLA